VTIRVNDFPERDRWAKADIIARISIPVLIATFGLLYNQNHLSVTEDPKPHPDAAVPVEGAAFLSKPKRDGTDVLVPDLLVRAIPRYDKDKPVYAATDLNGWLVSGRSKASDEALRLTRMTREGHVWRARSMVGKRFHPSQLYDVRLDEPFTARNVAWARIESVYLLSAEFVDTSSGSPCLLLK